jgi:hypothetical protein
VIRAIIVFILSNYSLSFLLLGFLVAFVAVSRSSKPMARGALIEELLTWYVFFAIGLGNVYNFIMHVFFGAMAARFIGWPDSPFQFEAGMARLGFGVVGMIASFRSFDARLVAVIGPGIFMLGAAVGHVRQMMTAHNLAPGNSGVVFHTDIFIPVIGFLLLWQWWYSNRLRAD